MSWAEWLVQVARLLAEAESPPFRAGDRLPGSRTVTYQTVLSFDQVVEARTEWDDARQRLERLRDLVAALGLAGNVPGRPGSLPIPPGFTADQARARLQELEKAYAQLAEWTIPAGLPDAIAVELRRAAETNYQNLVQAGQDVVLRQLQRVSKDRETPQGSRGARLVGQHDAAAQLERVGPHPGSPRRPEGGRPRGRIERAFLRQDRFELELRSLTLQIPDDLKVRPVGPLTVYHRPDGEARSLTFKLLGEGRRDPRRRVTSYTLVPEGATSLTYRPGEQLWAELPLRDADNRDWRFTWSVCRSLAYQFERLLRSPRLHRPNQENTEGSLAEGVSLSVTPERGLPRVPDLLPVVKLSR